MNIRLQQATENDWKEIGEVESKSSFKFFKALTSKEELTDYVLNSKVFFIIFEGNKVGTVGFKKISDDTIKLEGLNVIPQYRKFGIGQKALEEIIKLILKEKFKKINLIVHPKNILALFLYLKNGFIINGYIENYFGDGEPRLKMEWGS